MTRALYYNRDNPTNLSDFDNYVGLSLQVLYYKRDKFVKSWLVNSSRIVILKSLSYKTLHICKTPVEYGWQLIVDFLHLYVTYHDNFVGATDDICHLFFKLRVD